MSLYWNVLEHLKAKVEHIRVLDFSNLTKEEIERFEYDKFVHKFSEIKLFRGNYTDRDWVVSLGRVLKKKLYL